MSKLSTIKPVLIMVYGYPGAGKSFFARQISDTLGAAHLQADKLREELFEKPQFDKQEDDLIDHLMMYMAEEFLNADMSVIYDTNAARLAQRRELRNLSIDSKAESLLVWLQIDSASAQARLNQRDKRKSDDKYAKHYDAKSFQEYIHKMQNPKGEDYIVVSGKHTHKMQSNAIVKKLLDLGLISRMNAGANVVKPGLVNLIPNQIRNGRVDESRRDIYIKQ